MTLPVPCLDCGVATERNRCPDCQAVESARRDALARSRAKRQASRSAYGNRWRTFSERVRRQVDCCEECGATSDLTVDHSRQAHERQAKGLAVRMQDVRVLCRSCNSKAGRARPDARGS